MSDDQMQSGPNFVLERDIDVLLAEELTCSIPFLELLWKKLPGRLRGPVLHDDQSVRVTISVSGEGNGESDLVIDVSHLEDGQVKKTRILIEDKIDADFQPRQAERYRERIHRALGFKTIDEGFSVLAAPDKYVTTNLASQGFDAILRYEEVASYYEGRITTTHDPEMRSRFQFRRDLIQIAINKQKKGWVATNTNDAVTEFHQKYYQISSSVAPKLKLAAPGHRNSPETWIYFRSALKRSAILSAVDMIHKPLEGQIRIQIGSWGPHLGSIKSQLDALLLPDMTLERATQSTAFRLDVPKLAPDQPIEPQAADVHEALNKLMTLQTWFELNLPLLERVQSSLKLESE